MKVLIFDTETTGLPEKDATVFQHSKWPYIIQLSYLLYDLETNTYKYRNDYIKISDSVEMNPESYEIHKISREFLNNNGISINNALRRFNEYLNIADVIVGHNLSFDKKIVLVECYRNRIVQRFKYFVNGKKYKVNEYCTMKNGKSFCNIVRINRLNNSYLKTPSLKELFNKSLPEVTLPNNLHDAFIDILITFRCYYKLITSNDILLINQDLKNIYLQKLNFD